MRHTFYVGEETFVGYKHISDVRKRIYVDGVPTRYYVTLFGSIYNSETWHKLVPAIVNGYHKVLIYYAVNGHKKRKMFSVHRLVAQAFLDIPKHIIDPVVNHIDGNKTNNDVSNLEWVTQSENAIHAFKMHLRYAKLGKDCNFTKYNDEVIHNICRELQDNKLTFPQIAKKYGVSRKMVSRIFNGDRRPSISKLYDFSGYTLKRKCNRHKDK